MRTRIERRGRTFAATCVLLALAGLGGGLAASCNSSVQSVLEDPPVDLAMPDAGPRCVKLRCQIEQCKDRPSGTTITGVVNIPAGTLPLYNATVYIPNGRVAPIKNGASCDRCDQVYSGDPIVSATTDVSGRFTLVNAPSGKDIPLVIRLGKWRRQVVIPSVAPCTENTLGLEDTRLPRNTQEGDLPKFALVTGEYDATECLLRKIGIDDSEFTLPGGSGHVNLFAGHGGTKAYRPRFNNGAAFPVASDTSGMSDGWWSKPGNLTPYDILVLSCEGQQFMNEKSLTARQALKDYIDIGGRVFASHWQNAWIVGGPAPLPTVATFFPQNMARNYQSVMAGIETSHDKGAALADWLLNFGASMQRGQLPIQQARSTVISINKNIATSFVYYDDPLRMMRDEQYFSFFAPIGVPPREQCGRMVFTDIHVSGNDAGNPTPGLDLSGANWPFPNGCLSTSLSPQEKALIFLLFDLTNCLQPEIG